MIGHVGSSYQNGSIWPHDTGIIALGFRRYGYVAESADVQQTYAEQQRTLRIIGCRSFMRPQAWAAGSVFAFLRAILGLQPDTPGDRLYLDPVLPDWLPDVVLTDLKVGERGFDLCFWRDDRETRWEVLRGDANLVAHRSFATGVQL